MKTVLIIAYYFPPMGSSGVQRPLKFVKYLPDFGWKPIVLAPEPGAYHTFDYTLLDELDGIDCNIHRIPVNTPFHIAGGNPKKIDFIPEKMASGLRWVSNFFWLPDNKKGWIKPAAGKALELINRYNIDLVFATAPPYSNHVILKRIKEATGLPSVADLRDDWLENHQINYPTSFHKNRMKKIEQNCLAASDAITVLNKATRQSILGRLKNKHLVKIVPHGYDEEDFRIKTFHHDDNKIRILYSGRFYDRQQPDIFLKAVKKLLKDNPYYKKKIQLQFQGGLSKHHHNLIKKLDLEYYVQDLGYVDHKKAVENLLKADILWLILGYTKNSETVTLGKLFEYMAARKPIVGLVPDGETKKMLKSYRAAYTAHPRNKKAVIRVLNQAVKSCLNGKLKKPEEQFIHSFSRKSITGNLSELFNKLVC